MYVGRFLVMGRSPIGELSSMEAGRGFCPPRTPPSRSSRGPPRICAVVSWEVLYLGVGDDVQVSDADAGDGRAALLATYRLDELPDRVHRIGSIALKSGALGRPSRPSSRNPSTSVCPFAGSRRSKKPAGRWPPATERFDWDGGGPQGPLTVLNWRLSTSLSSPRDARCT